METSTPAWSESTLGDLTAHQAVRDLKLGDEGEEAIKKRGIAIYGALA